MLNSIINDTTISSITLVDALICIGAAILLGGVISYTHKLTTKTTQNFLLTLAVLPVLIQVVILLINGNLGTSVAVAGAFSLVRFRSLPRKFKRNYKCILGNGSRSCFRNGLCRVCNNIYYNCCSINNSNK